MGTVPCVLSGGGEKRRGWEWCRLSRGRPPARCLCDCECTRNVGMLAQMSRLSSRKKSLSGAGLLLVEQFFLCFRPAQVSSHTISSMQASLSSRAVIARRPTAAAPRQVRACGLSPAHCPPSPPMAAISTWTGGQGVRSSGWWAGCWCNPWPSLRPSRAPSRRLAGPPGFQAGGAGLQGHPEDPFRRAGVCALRVALLRGPGPLYAAAMIRWQHPSRGQPPQPLSEAGRPCTTPI